MTTEQVPGYDPEQDPKFAPIVAGVIAYYRCTRDEAEEFTRLILAIEHLTAEETRRAALAFQRSHCGADNQIKSVEEHLAMALPATVHQSHLPG